MVLSQSPLKVGDRFATTLFLLGNGVLPRAIAAYLAGSGLLSDQSAHAHVWCVMRDFRDGALRYATLSTFWLVGGVVEGARAKRTISTFHFHFHFSSAPCSRAARRVLSGSTRVGKGPKAHFHFAFSFPLFICTLQPGCPSRSCGRMHPHSSSAPYRRAARGGHVVECIRTVHLHSAAVLPDEVLWSTCGRMHLHSSSAPCSLSARVRTRHKLADRERRPA